MKVRDYTILVSNEKKLYVNGWKNLVHASATICTTTEHRHITHMSVGELTTRTSRLECFISWKVAYSFMECTYCQLWWHYRIYCPPKVNFNVDLISNAKTLPMWRTRSICFCIGFSPAWRVTIFLYLHRCSVGSLFLTFPLFPLFCVLVSVRGSACYAYWGAAGSSYPTQAIECDVVLRRREQSYMQYVCFYGRWIATGRHEGPHGGVGMYAKWQFYRETGKFA